LSTIRAAERGPAFTSSDAERVYLTGPGSSFARRADLCADGWTDRAILDGVRSGRLLRPRGGVYLPADAPAPVIAACRAGGRLACISALAQAGVFVLDSATLHVHVQANASRLHRAGPGLHRHWGRLHREPHPRATSIELFDALIQAVTCQPPRAAVATLDSALHTGVLPAADLDELFRILPARLAVLRRLIDPRSESGPETLVRLMLRSLGLRFEVQVGIRGVGRVDFLVEGWLIIECDSLAHHSTWDAQRRDRRRDQAAAALGYATYRPIAEDIMWDPGVVLAALRGLAGGRRASRIQENRRGARPSQLAARRVS
jgi:very-short-patch-repair endonuclease